MSNGRLSATLREEVLCDDAALCSSRTDCIDLNPEDEETVTAAIKALQHQLKRVAGNRDETNAIDWPTDGLIDCITATEYLAHFSYGLRPGEGRYVVYRYLKSNSMSIPKALEDLSRCAEFRKKQNLDKMALFPCLISISGYDQAAMCEELRIPFIHNLTSGKRYVDAEGRLRLEQDQLDYYNVPYEEIYANLGATADAAAASTPVSTPHGLTDSTPTFFNNTNAAAHNGAKKSTSGGGGGGGGLADGRHAEDEDNNRRMKDSFDSMFSSEDGARRKQNASADPSSTGGWRSFLPFHFFGRGKEKEKSSSPGPHSRSPSVNNNNSNNKSPDGRKMGRFQSALSVNGSLRNEGGEEHEDSEDVADNQSAASRGAILLNSAAAGEALSGNPYTLYHDSLNFHGILQPIIAVITKHVPFAFHYWDREGHPIMYCRLSGLNSKRLMRDLFALTPVDAEPRALSVLFNTYALAVVEQLIRFCNRKNMESNEIHDALLTQVQRRDRNAPASSVSAGLFRKKAPVGSCVVVVDCAGLHVHRYLYKPLLVMIKSIVRLNVRHYPELMHHAYITNCGAAMSFSYLMIRSLLSEETRQKVTFCSRHNSASTLLETISSDLLPQELGGKCQCPGGCIPSVAAAMPERDPLSLSRSRGDNHSSSMSPNSETSSVSQMGDHFGDRELVVHPLHCTVERLNLGPHGSKTLSFAMDAHTEIIWEFMAKEKQKVTFSAVFVSAGDDGAMLSLVPRRRVRNDAGHYISTSYGTVIFKWSNKRSYFRHCRVNLKVYREEQTVATMDGY